MKENSIKNIYNLIAISCIVFYSSLNAQWVQMDLTGTTVNAFAVLDTNLFAGTSSGVFLSSNNGTSWTAVNTGLTNTNIRALVVSGTNLFAGTFGDGVFRTTNNGTNWTEVNTGLMDTVVTAFAVSDINLFAGTYYSGVFLSTNNGTSWTAVDSGMIGYHANSVSSLTVSNTNLFAGTYGNIFFSTNNGTSWTQADSGLVWNQPGVLALAANGANMYAGLNGSGVFLSTNNGTGWTNVGGGGSVTDLLVSGTNLFSSTYEGSVFLSKDNGASWTAIDSGLPNISVGSLSVSDRYIFAGTTDGVWRRPLSEIITGVKDQSNEIPSQFILEQNYPNPFNPSTTIRFQVPSSSFVNLKVYDVLGNEVATLVNEEKLAGSYEVNFDAKGLSSGIYFYTLNAGSVIETKKMILLK
jgi:photosystem II stability/assembly factor-like uncharacterized protein